MGIVRPDLPRLAIWFVTQQAVAAAGEPKSTVPTTAFRFPPQPTSEPFIPRTVAVSLQSNGSSGRQSSGASISITPGAGMGASDTSSTFPLTVITPRPTLSSSTMANIGTVARSAIRSQLSDRRWCGGQLHGKRLTMTLCNGPSIYATLGTRWLRSGNMKSPLLGQPPAAPRSRRKRTPTRLFTTSSLTKTRARLNARPATSRMRASTYPSQSLSRTPCTQSPSTLSPGTLLSLSIAFTNPWSAAMQRS